MAARKRIARVLTHALIILLGIIMLYPVLWMVVSAFKPNSLVFSDTSLLSVFKSPTLENFGQGWKGYSGVKFSRFFLNSIFISVCSIGANLLSCSMASYAFGRLKFKGRGIWFACMMLGIMLPAHVTTIPRFVMYNGFNWIDSYFPIIIPKLLATDTFFVFLLVQFVRALPRDLDEAATIDGCGQIGIFFRIIVPLAAPALITTALFTFLWTWDDFFNQLLYVNTTTLFTVPLGLRSFVDASGESNWGAVLAMSTLSMIPCFVLFFSLQKYFVEGIATSGIKG